MKLGSRRFLPTVVCIFLVALLSLGLLLQSLVKSQLSKNAYQRLDNNAAVLSELASSYYNDGTISNLQFILNLDLTARVSGTDALICDESGRITLCSDSPNGCSHQGYTLTEGYRERIIREGGSLDECVLTNVYDDERYICARPVYDPSTGQVAGFVVVSLPVADTMGNLAVFSNYVMISMIVVLMLVMLLMLVYYKRKDNPLRQLSHAARSFGHGNLDARVNLDGDYHRDVEELALAFNNMADSLQKSEYSRQEFVANVSHELKTPMTTIGGYIDGILDGTIPEGKQRHYMQIVSAETKRLSRLVRSMLDISQLQGEGGIPEEKMSRFDVEECAGQMLITFEQKILSKSINVEVEMPEYPVYTMANRDYISQVIYNLLDNAVKFCPQDGTLWLTVRQDDTKAYISIANQGETIPPEELSLLFDRFHKIDKSRTQNRDGWGLGLYIVKTIIGLHGQDISVTSADNKTEFTFTLPLVD